MEQSRLFEVLKNPSLYGSDVDLIKVNNTIRNLNWLFEELEEPIPPLLDERFRKIDINFLSNSFQQDFFNGICTEPSLGPFYKKKPYYSEVILLPLPT